MTDYQFVGYGTHHSLPTLIMVDRNIVGFDLAMERLTNAEREFNWAPGDAWGPDFGLQDTIETRVFCLAVEQALLASMEEAANDLVAPFPAVEVGSLMAIEPLRFHAGALPPSPGPAAVRPPCPASLYFLSRPRKPRPFFPPPFCSCDCAQVRVCPSVRRARRSEAVSSLPGRPPRQPANRRAPGTTGRYPVEPLERMRLAWGPCVLS